VHVLCFNSAPPYPTYPDFDSRPTDPLDSITVFVGVFSLRLDIKEVGWVGGCGLDIFGTGREKWRAVMNAAMNIRVLRNAESL
jgi:hypothetical protein